MVNVNNKIHVNEIKVEIYKKRKAKAKLNLEIKSLLNRLSIMNRSSMTKKQMDNLKPYISIKNKKVSSHTTKK